MLPCRVAEKAHFQNRLHWPFLFFLWTKSTGWSNRYIPLLSNLVTGFKLEKQRSFGICFFNNYPSTWNAWQSDQRIFMDALWTILRAKHRQKIVTIRYQQSHPLRWPWRLRWDGLCGHLSSVQHSENSLYSAPTSLQLLLLPPGHLYSLLHMRLLKRFHIFIKKKYFITTKLSALIVQIRKRKPKYLQKFMTYVFGLGWGGLPHSLIACLPNSIRGI